MRRTVHKLRPAKGYSHIVHNILNLVYVGLLVLLVRLDFYSLAFALVLLSKWRIVAVKPRHWVAHVRVNLVDIFLGLSILSYMFGTLTLSTQLVWAGLFVLWLIILKPRSDKTSIALQALISQTIALCALFRNFTSLPATALIAVTWLITFAAANHFLTAFEEENVRVLSHIWALFSATLAWILVHWMIFYGNIPQLAIVLGILSYAFSGIYILHSHERLTIALKRQFVLVALALVVMVLVFSDWQSIQF